MGARTRSFFIWAAAVLLAAVSLAPAAPGHSEDAAHWVGTWAASPQPTGARHGGSAPSASGRVNAT
jgi:hypothetical protein